MGVISICFIVVLITFGPFSGRGYSREPSPGPCQPFSTNQTAHCSGLETLVHNHGAGTFCNRSEVSCRPNKTFSLPSRNKRYWGLCYCDPLCQEIGDCCVDYDMWYTPRLSNHKPKPLKESCQRQPSNKEKQILGYIMVASCPSSWSNDQTAHACMSTNYSADPTTALPVLDMTTNVTYANIYCTMCHGKSSNLHHWSLRIAQKPRQPVSLQDITSADTIWQAVPVGEIIPKKCIVTPSKASVGPDTVIKQLCRSYANGIQISNRDTHTQQIVFDDLKNPHCALLSNLNVFVNRTVRCLKNNRFPSRMLTILFVFSIHGKNSNNFRESTLRMKVNCPINEVYDPFKGRCLPVHTDANSDGANSSEQCRGPSFPSNELVILSNDSVFLIPHQKLYDNGTYIVVNQTLILCSVNFSRNYTKIATPTGHVKKETPAHPLALRIITYIGFSLSIISLLFLLVTYFLFAELRTYPGKKVMHLSCAMIAMQTVYFVSDPDVVSSAACAVIGSLLHYFILVVFLWMSVIAHNTRKSLSTMNVNPHNPVVIAKRRKAYIRYSVLAWGFPLVVIGICVSLQFANIGNVGYGVEDGCQLSIPARTFAVAVPVSASLLFNIISVIASVVAIRQHSQGNTLAASQSNRNLTLIVLKLTAVTGGTWILGFILAFYPTPYLEYPFIIINSCQGVLICVSFVFKKNVFNLFKQRFNPTTLPEPTAREEQQQQQQQQCHSEDTTF